MHTHHCVTKDGEHLIIKQSDNGMYCCPVCGSAVHEEMPYTLNGVPSFEICSNCGFQFGYDDSPLATETAVDGIKSNWKRWLIQHIEEVKTIPSDLDELMNDLKNINIELAFDLLPVERVAEQGDSEGTPLRGAPDL